MNGPTKSHAELPGKQTKGSFWRRRRNGRMQDSMSVYALHIT